VRLRSATRLSVVSGLFNPVFRSCPLSLRSPPARSTLDPRELPTLGSVERDRDFPAVSLEPSSQGLNEGCVCVHREDPVVPLGHDRHKFSAFELPFHLQHVGTLGDLLKTDETVGRPFSSGQAYEVVALASPARDRSGDGETLCEPLLLSPEAPPVDEPLLVGKLGLEFGEGLLVFRRKPGRRIDELSLRPPIVRFAEPARVIHVPPAGIEPATHGLGNGWSAKSNPGAQSAVLAAHGPFSARRESVRPRHPSNGWKPRTCRPMAIR
jgi:hypothetical protein